MVRLIIAMFLRRHCTRKHTAWEQTTLQQKSQRRELARFYHYKGKGLLAPRRAEYET